MSCSLQGESEIVFIRSQSEHVVFYVGYAFGRLIWDPQERRTYATATSISRERRACGEIRMCLGEAPMTLQERQGILRKLTTRETKLQTTMMQPMGKDLGFSVDWLIPQVRS